MPAWLAIPFVVLGAIAVVRLALGRDAAPCCHPVECPDCFGCAVHQCSGRCRCKAGVAVHSSPELFNERLREDRGVVRELPTGCMSPSIERLL